MVGPLKRIVSTNWFFRNRRGGAGVVRVAR